MIKDINRVHNVGNKYQGPAKRVLCVCSAGLLRSPTTAVLLQQEYGYNTRAAGIDTHHALIPVDHVLVSWADEIICMDEYQVNEIKRLYVDYLKTDVKIVSLNVPDDYGYMNPRLQQIIKRNYAEWLKKQSQPNTTSDSNEIKI